MRRWSGLWAVMAGVVVAGIVALPAPARAWQAFAKITTSTGATIDGDVTLKGFEKQINILGLGNQLERDFSIGSAGPVEGKLNVGPFDLVKAFDIASPKLIAAMAASTILSKVEITIFKTTPTGSAPGFKLLLTNAHLLKIGVTYDPGATPSALEKVELLYQKLTWTDLTSGVTGSTP